MRGLVPARRAFGAQVVDGRPKAGHDGMVGFSVPKDSGNKRPTRRSLRCT
jgi:hypothetical protein